MNLYFRHLGFLVLSTILISSLSASDNAHFYRATNFLYEPRLELDYLTSLDLYFQGGSTSKARNRNHDTVPLLDIYGPSNMHELAIGVPCKDLSNPLDMIIQNLSLIPSRCATAPGACKKQQEFATFSIGGEFSIIEGLFTFAQNLKRGFFVQLYFPVRRLKITNICYCDISPTDEACPNINTPIWQIFKNNFDAILARYDLSREPFCKTGIGDITVLLGWTHSFQNTEVLDFVDTTIKFGMLIPSGDQQCPDLVFSLPLGYDGHWAAVIAGDFAFGAFDWLTLGAHFDVLVFGNKTKCIRLKTGEFQNGWFKLAKGETKREKGALWQIDAYIKFDHFVRGLSLLFGYIFASKNRDELTPCNTELFCPAIANDDEMLFGWKMHTLNFMLEYDFSSEKSIVGPRISFYYNYVAGGKRIFLTDIAGGNFGVDFAWDF
jgi:hypothetical protein